MQQTCHVAESVIHAGKTAESGPRRRRGGKTCLRRKCPVKEALQRHNGLPFHASMHGMPHILLFVLCLASVTAIARQDPLPVTTAIDAWLQGQSRGLPGQVSWEIGEIDPGNQLSPCNAFDISRPAGSRPWGRGNVLVTCLAPSSWRLYVSVHIHVSTDYLVSARPIAQGNVIGPDDLATMTGDLSALPANILTESQLAVGKVATTSIPVGRPLRADMLKGQLVVRQNQTVKVV
jgi:flagella basal body P-ring formation protein FlgA